MDKNPISSVVTNGDLEFRAKPYWQASDYAMKVGRQPAYMYTMLCPILEYRPKKPTRIWRNEE